MMNGTEVRTTESGWVEETKVEPTPECVTLFGYSTSTNQPTAKTVRHRQRHFTNVTRTLTTVSNDVSKPETLRERWRKTFEDRWEPYFERLWKNKAVIQRRISVVLSIIMSLAIILTIAGRKNGYVSDGIQPTFVHQGEEGVDFTRTSTAITCKELRGGIMTPTNDNVHDRSVDRMQTAATYLLNGPQSPVCVCGPMFGPRKQYMAIRSNTSIHHFFNPILDDTWDGITTDGTYVEKSTTLLPESQRVLIPGQAGTVEMPRENIIRIRFTNRDCSFGAVILQQKYAWCAQASIDLLNGKTVYDE